MSLLRAKRVAVAALIFVLPSWALRRVLPWFGCTMRGGARIGFSLVLADRVQLGEMARIGHFNLIVCRRLLLRREARIGSINFIRGPFSLCIGERGWMAKRNQATRAGPPVVAGPSLFMIERGAGITTGHRIDCTASVRLREFSILAGSGTQVWTHGYVHAESGPGRYRIDGPVVIGKSTYVGARCLFNLGVHVCDGAIIGAGVIVSKSLDQPALYVGAALRMLPRPKDPELRSDMTFMPGLCEVVYRKRTKA